MNEGQLVPSKSHWPDLIWVNVVLVFALIIFMDVAFSSGGSHPLWIGAVFYLAVALIIALSIYNFVVGKQSSKRASIILLAFIFAAALIVYFLNIFNHIG